MVLPPSTRNARGKGTNQSDAASSATRGVNTLTAPRGACPMQSTRHKWQQLRRPSYPGPTAVRAAGGQYGQRGSSSLARVKAEDGENRRPPAPIVERTSRDTERPALSISLALRPLDPRFVCNAYRQITIPPQSISLVPGATYAPFSPTLKSLVHLIP